jgi:hypothetical protein
MNLAHQQWPLWQRRNSPCRHHGNPAISQPNAESQLAHRIRLLVNAASAARASAAQMTLGDWRDVEREVKQRLEDDA